MDRNRRIKKRRYSVALLAKRKALASSYEPDAAPDTAQPGSRELIKQAERDVSRGLRDTDLHGVPSNVPGPGPDPDHSPGALLPPDGVDVPDRKS